MSDYRIVNKGSKFEPQMESHIGMTGQKFWTPLAANGYWADPDSYSFGVVHKDSLMTEQEAIQAITNAKKINQEQRLAAARTETASEAAAK